MHENKPISSVNLKLKDRKRAVSESVAPTEAIFKTKHDSASTPQFRKCSIDSSRAMIEELCKTYEDLPSLFEQRHDAASQPNSNAAGTKSSNKRRLSFIIANYFNNFKNKLH
jgi:hypothetical protein